MIPIDATELANAPLLGLLSVIALALITLVGVAIRAITEQSDTTSDALSKQVSEMSLQLREALRRADEAWKEALASRLETKEIRSELDDTQEKLEQVSQQNSELRIERDVALERVTHLEKQNQELKQEVLRLQEEIKKLEERLAQFETTFHHQRMALPITPDEPLETK